MLYKAKSAHKTHIILCRTCLITCDSDALNKVPKAWIPDAYGSQKLWWQKDDTAISNYIKGPVDSTWDPTKIFRSEY